MDAVVSQVAVWEDASVAPWPGARIPSMDFPPVIVDHPHDAASSQVCEEREAWGHCFVVDAAKAGSSAVKCALLHDECSVVRPKAMI